MVKSTNKYSTCGESITKTSATGSMKRSIQYGSIHGGSYKQNSIRSSNRTDHSSKSNRYKYAKLISLSDLMAAMYPGIKVGHRYCVQRRMLVPKTMGWLWNTEDTATGVPFPKGWRPGAIALGVKKRFSRPRSITEPLSTPIGSKGKKVKRKLKTTSSITIDTKLESYMSYREQILTPTLRVQKERGVYQVMVQPIRDATAQENKSEELPVQFQIAENSTRSCSRTSGTSSSSLKIEYMCTGALRKPIIKPELSEMGTQWDVSDFEKKEKVKDKGDKKADALTNGKKEEKVKTVEKIKKKKKSDTLRDSKIQEKDKTVEAINKKKKADMLTDEKKEEEGINKKKKKDTLMDSKKAERDKPVEVINKKKKAEALTDGKKEEKDKTVDVKKK